MLRGLAGVAALGSAGAAINRISGARAGASGLSVTVLLDEPIGTIRPAIYSQFAEHIGGVIYDGIWVGPDSKVAEHRRHPQGARRACQAARAGRRALAGRLLRRRYHWRDGIGPRRGRPRRFGRWREETETNQFGTHEFIRFCRLCEVEPYFAANVGTGSPEEFQQWVEYCNAPAGSTTLADERAANGEREPLGIRYWGVGNESWGCGGKFMPEDYCREYRRFTEWLPEYGVPLYLIAAGPERQRPRLDPAVLRQMGRRRTGTDPRLGAALLLRDDRPCPQVHDRPVVRAALQGQPDGDADQRPVGGPRRV